MNLREKLEKKRFVITAEVCQPNTPDKEEVLRQANLLRDCDALNSFDCPMGKVFMSSLASSLIIKEHGFEPIMQMTCRDRNRVGIESDLIGARALGIENLLAIRGDHTSNPVYELDSIKLIRLASGLGFFVGGAVNPNVKTDKEVKRMEMKIKSGAGFFQTQVVFDLDAFKRFINLTRDLDANVLVSVLPLKDEKMAKDISKIPGIIIPEWIMKSLRIKTGTEICYEFISQVKDDVAGVHVLPYGNLKAAVEIIKKLRSNK